MRIEPKLEITPVADARESQRREIPRDSPASEATVVSISTAGARAAEAKGPDKGMTARLERIKAMIDSDSYPVDLDKLAERIADDEILRSRRS